MNSFLDAAKKHALLGELTNLEQKLTRRDRKTMELLLHPDFVEFGRSGTRYTRADVLRMFADTVLPAIEYHNLELAVLAEGVALLTYLSADTAGIPHTLRSSVWIHTELGWHMRFHQGTGVHESNC